MERPFEGCSESLVIGCRVSDPNEPWKSGNAIFDAGATALETYPAMPFGHRI